MYATSFSSTWTRNGLRKPIEWISGRVFGCGAPFWSGNRFPAGMVYAPVPEPKSALLASAAAMVPSLTLMRMSLPRRSLEFSAPRRESPVGRWYQPPSCCVVTATVGVAPVRAAPSIVSCAWLDCALPRRKNTFRFAVLAGPPLVWISFASMFESASSAASTSRSGRVERERRRRLAVERERVGAARRVREPDDLLLVGELVVHRPVAAAVDAAGGVVVARDQPQVVVLVEVDVTRDVAALLAVDRLAQDLLLRAEVEPGAVRVLDELEPRQLEVADVRVPRVLVRRRDRRRRRGRGLGDDRAVGQLDVGDRLRRVEEVHPLVVGEVVVDRRAVHAVLGVRVRALGQRHGRGSEVGEDRRLARRRVVQADAAAAVGLQDPAVRELIEADRLVRVRRGADLGLLVVAQHRGAAVAVGRVALAGGPADRALQVRLQAGVVAGRRAAERGVEAAPGLVVLAPGHRVVGAHRAAVDALEHLALRLGLERLLDDAHQHVRDAADVRVEVVVGLGALPVLREVLARVMDAVGDLDGRELRCDASGRTRAEQSGHERPGRVGLDRRADADEAAALLVVRLEVRALRVRERTRHARVQEHDRAVLVESLGGELRADRGGRGGRDDAVGADRGGDRAHARGRGLVGRARHHEHLVRLDRLRFRVRGRRGQQDQARKSQAHTSPPHRLSNRRVALS